MVGRSMTAAMLAAGLEDLVQQQPAGMLHVAG